MPFLGLIDWVKSSSALRTPCAIAPRLISDATLRNPTVNLMNATHLLAAAAVGLTLVCVGCAGRPSQGVLVPIAATAEGTSRVAVLAATTRQRSTTDPGEMFNGERANDVSYASVVVSIPPDSVRKIGAIQWPATVPGDPSRDFVTVSADYMDQKAFTAAVDDTAKQPGRSRVLVFVHGFNNRFDDAVYRFAQIIHDSKAPAIPVLFTWPSLGQLRLRAYTYDRESTNFSRDALEELLDMLAKQPKVTEINILAHSMGNWITLEALRGRSIRASRTAYNAKSDKLKNVLMVAPDVDVDVFRTELQRMGPIRPRISLFVSRDDEALRLSRFLWGGVPRLGDVNANQEPYQAEFERNRIEVFDLTTLRAVDNDAHDRAFDEAPTVAAMIRKRLSLGQELTTSRDTDIGEKVEEATISVR
jgi:esterase/lipase superfamily enzyme